MSFNKRAYIISALRKASYRSPARNEALKSARVDRNQYLCARCSAIFGRKEVQVDHVIPIIDPITGFTSWDSYIERMFCEKDNLQILCRPCHKEKTKAERASKRLKRNKKEA